MIMFNKFISGSDLTVMLQLRLPLNVFVRLSQQISYHRRLLISSVVIQKRRWSNTLKIIQIIKSTN